MSLIRPFIFDGTSSPVFRLRKRSISRMLKKNEDFVAENLYAIAARGEPACARAVAVLADECHTG